MDTAVASGAISPLKRTNITHISHLLFADDLLVFCKGSKDSAKRLNLLLNQLELNTGLVVNNKKSKVFFSKGCKAKAQIANMLGVCSGSLPIRYLGLPVSVSYPKARHSAPSVDKVREKVEGWMAKALSMSGRV